MVSLLSANDATGDEQLALTGSDMMLRLGIWTDVWLDIYDETFLPGQVYPWIPFESILGPRWRE